MMQYRMVLWLQMQLSRRMWFCSCCHHAVHGVMGTIVGLHYVVVMVAMPCAVSQSLLLCRMVLSSQSCHV
jgi:hypothetical protein